MHKKKILVTGSSGFIGRYLVKELKRRNMDVATLADSAGAGIDVRDWRKIIKEIKGVDIIYHLAAVVHAPFSIKRPRETYEVNVLGTLNMLELCRRLKAKNMVFLSSYVYGKPEYMPIDEKHPIQPNNIYMRSKVLGEDLCRAYNADFGIKCVIFRVFNVYGERQAGDFLIPAIISQLDTGKVQLKDPAPKRDYVYISDLIDALIKTLNFNGNFEVFNIGSGESHSVKEIADKIIRIYGNRVKIIYKRDRHTIDKTNIVADIDKARKMLGWNPKISLDEGLKRCVLNDTGGE